MEIRILVSATNSGRTFDLRCEVREKLIDFIQREYPKALPQIRLNSRRYGAQTYAFAFPRTNGCSVKKTILRMLS